MNISGFSDNCPFLKMSRYPKQWRTSSWVNLPLDSRTCPAIGCFAATERAASMSPMRAARICRGSSPKVVGSTKERIVDRSPPSSVWHSTNHASFSLPFGTLKFGTRTVVVTLAISSATFWSLKAASTHFWVSGPLAGTGTSHFLPTGTPKELYCAPTPARRPAVVGTYRTSVSLPVYGSLTSHLFGTGLDIFLCCVCV